AVLEEQALGCLVRNDPAVPTQRLLRALVRMKESGQIDRIVQRYGAADYTAAGAR
ncbi:MAG TPA: amino acid ABC transporter substrate-binding protein, partial [Pseudomonas sp.]|nr:amino acid ABC transporter substrate-binding protein [Pseudomonas sp.]